MKCDKHICKIFFLRILRHEIVIRSGVYPLDALLCEQKSTHLWFNIAVNMDAVMLYKDALDS